MPLAQWLHFTNTAYFFLLTSKSVSNFASNQFHLFIVTFVLILLLLLLFVQCNPTSTTTVATAETTTTTATTSNGGSAYIMHNVQTHPNQNSLVSTKSATPTPTSTSLPATEAHTPISPVQTSNTDGGAMSCQYERFTAGNIINEKQINRTNSNDGNGDGTAHNDQLYDAAEKSELSFQNLQLKCMCSSDGGEAANYAKPTEGNKRDADGGDDEIDIEISDVEAVTEIAESMLKSHLCSHCGRDHCCFLLRCCFCIANEIGTTFDCDAAAAAATTTTPDADALCKSSSRENDFDTHSNNNITSDLPTTNKYTHSTNPNQNQNLASKRCDEICKIIHNASDGDGSGAKCNTMVAATQQCCDDGGGGGKRSSSQTNDEYRATVCHCRWYCIQDCDLDAKANTANIATAGTVDDCKKDETTLAVQKPEMLSPITNASPANDENSLRCCRCSKELF